MIIAVMVSIINDNCAALCRPRKRTSHPSNAQEEQNDGQVTFLSVAVAPYFPVDCVVLLTTNSLFRMETLCPVPGCK
jgi:hypothetical protein